MAGITLLLLPPEEQQSEAVIQSYYDFVEQKREEYCDPSIDLSITESKQRSLNYLNDDGEFFVSEPVSRSLYRQINEDRMSEILDGGWILPDDRRSDLLDLLRNAVAQAAADSQYSPEEYRCYVETGVLALCEFAIQEDHAIQILD